MWVVSQSQAGRTWWPWGPEAVTLSQPPSLGISRQPSRHFKVGAGGGEPRSVPKGPSSVLQSPSRPQIYVSPGWQWGQGPCPV